ncbi:MAG: SDR family NAD(P)-dependent oxidoreductase [Flavihumibacter sp.]
MMIVVTGASKGIGKSIARAFAAGSNTVLLGSRGETALYHTLQEMQTDYPQAIVKAKPADFR